MADDLGSLADAFERPEATAIALPPGAVIGEHFAIDGVLGRGGMGAVYSAIDRRLGRRVAIKLGRPGADVARARREAAALARLAHPNVVTIHEIGEHSGALFVAMELCEGGTAASWVRADRRTWREVLAIYGAAGRGLAAAHAAGVVHRDVKPDNILIGADGRARIADFGLAVTADDGAGALAIAGTPRYMAPEQLAGGPVDARTDQFGFCVALHEALAGVAPFPTATAARADAIARGAIAAPAASAPRVPRRVMAAIARGLAGDPARRWPTLTALLDALDAAARGPARLVGAAIAVAALAATTAVALVAVGSRRPAPAPGCGSIDAQVAAVWSPDTEAAIRAGGGSALATAIDGRLRAWRDLRATTCREASAGGSRALAALPTLACLDQRLTDLAAVIAVAGDGRPGESALVDGVDAQPPPSTCLDGPRAAQAEPRPPRPDLAHRVAGDRAALASAAAMARVGRFDEAIAAIDGLSAAGEFAPLAAEAAYVRGGVLDARGERSAAIAAYRDAVNRAAAAHHPAAQIAALLDLAYTLADDAPALDERAAAEIESLLALAESTLRGLVPDAELERHLLGNRTMIRVQLGDPGGAVDDGRTALALAETSRGPDSAEALVARLNLGTALEAAGLPAEAEATLAPALAAADRRWPRSHVTARRLAEALALLRLERGDLTGARPLVERALAASIEVDGDDSAAADRQRLTLASALFLQGEPAAAEALLRGVLDRLVARGDGASEHAAMARADLAMAEALQGRFELAAIDAAAALGVFERIHGGEHPMLVNVLLTLAMVGLDGGQPDRAEAPARRALAITRANLDGPALANPLATLALVQAVRGHAVEARALADAALAAIDPADDQLQVRGEAELARALATGDRTAGEAARAHLIAAGPAAAFDRARAERWLAGHRGRP